MACVQRNVATERPVLVSPMGEHVAGERVTSTERNHRAQEQRNTHQEHVAPAGLGSDEWWARVHAPAQIPEAMRMPAAKAAMGNAWNKLWGQGTWDVQAVRDKRRCHP